MSKAYLIILLILFMTASSGQYDTLYTRSNTIILMPKVDTLQELQEVNLKADTILANLQKIKCRLGIKDTIK